MIDSSYQMTMSMDAGKRLRPPEDSVMSLYELVSEYDRRGLLVPEHQREFVWSEKQTKAWVDRVIQSQILRPIGVIVTYQLSDGSPVFLNDGRQRVHASSLYFSQPEKYGHTKEYAAEVLRSCRVSIQHRHYPTHNDALTDFQLINIGTHLNLQEFCAGIFTYMENYQTMWYPLFQELQEIMAFASARISAKTKKNRNTDAKYLRDNYASFYRFLSKEKTTKSYDVRGNQPDYDKIKGKSVVEWWLRDEFEKLGPQEVRHQLGVFRGVIERETSLIEEVWGSVSSKGSGVSPTLFRWLLACSIWKRNNNIPHYRWEDFVKKVLLGSRGKPEVVSKSDPHHRAVPGLNDLGNIKTVCGVIDSDLWETARIKRVSKKSMARPGYDSSHVLPLFQHGEGETVFESAGRNRARGGEPIAEGEIPL